MALIMEVVPLGRLKEVVQGALTSPHAIFPGCKLTRA